MDPSQSIGHMTTEELYRQHAGFVARFLMRLSVPAEHLDDALQEVFLIVHRNGGYRPGLAKPTSYLANMAIYAARNHRQRHATLAKRHSTEPVELMPGDGQDLGHNLQVRRDLERLQQALADLPEELRTTVILVEIDGESCVSVAAGFNCPVGTVYSRLHAARKRLQAALRVREPQSYRTPGGLNQQTLLTRSGVMVMGFGEFRKSEAARLLQLAREQPEMTLPVDELLARMEELQRSTSLPSWASSYAPPTRTWLGIIGTPTALTLTAAAMAVAATLIVRVAPVPEARTAGYSPAAASSSPPRPEPIPGAQIVSSDQPPQAAERGLSMVAARAETPRRRERSVRARSSRSAPPSLGGPGAGKSDISPSAALPVAAALEPAPAAVLSTPAAAVVESPAAEPPQPEVARPARPSAEDVALAEIRTIEEAERTLASDPARTLDLTRSMQTRFAAGNLREERAYLELMALHKLGRADELRVNSSRFLQRYPSGVYSGRVRTVVGAGAR